MTIDELKKIYIEVPVGRAEDLQGRQFDRLTVLYRTKSPTNRPGVFWLCKCNCAEDKYTVTTSAHLKDGHTRSCGCVSKENLKKAQQGIDITGQTFGRLTAIKPLSKRKQGAIVWQFTCSCGGKLCEFPGTLVANGYIKSCGCYQREAHRVDLTNKQFGKLTALYPTEDRSPRDRSIMWMCRCSCDQQTELKVSTSDLNQGRKLSCGCLVSKGEQAIMDLLKQHNISYKTQKKFDTCKLSEHINSYAKFDFYIDNKYLIEFDGEQHFKYNNSGWLTKEKFDKTQRYDLIKNQWCKDNHIPLIRIPYTHYDDLCIEDLMLETTKFRVEGT